MLQRLLAFCLFVIALQACMPGTIKENTSQFDGSKQYIMQPAFVYSGGDTLTGGPFQIGLLWSDIDPKSLTFRTKIHAHIVSIERKGGLQFNIDGQIIKLSSPSAFTSHDVETANNVLYTETYRDFAGTTELLKRLLSANSVKVKLITSVGYLEGDLLIDTKSAAIRGFHAFDKKITMND